MSRIPALAAVCIGWLLVFSGYLWGLADLGWYVATGATLTGFDRSLLRAAASLGHPAVVRLLLEVCREEQATLLLASHDPDVLAQLDRVQDMHALNRAGAAP